MFDPETLPESIPDDYRQVAAALCAAVWRQEPEANLYLIDKKFKDEWERAAAFAIRLLSGDEEDLMTSSEDGDGPTLEDLAEALCGAQQGNEAIANAYSDPANGGVFKDEYGRGAWLLQRWLDHQAQNGPWKIVEVSHGSVVAVERAWVVAKFVRSDSHAFCLCRSLSEGAGPNCSYVYMPMAQPISSVL
jgi:hypothetical protein